MNQRILELNLIHKIIYEDLEALSFYEKVNQEIKFFSESSEHCLILKGEELINSYLLQAFYNRLVKENKCVFISLKNVSNYEILKNLESFEFIFIDSFNNALEKQDGELNLFNLYNFSKTNSKKLILGENASLENKSQLPDLTSRLKANLEISIPLLDDLDKKYLIKLELKKRGLLINERCLEYIMSRGSRNLESLLELVDKLDFLSLERKKNISIPLIKELIE